MNQQKKKLGIRSVFGLAAALLAAGLELSCSSPPPPPVLPAEEKIGPPIFEDVTKKTGIQFTYRNGEEVGNFAIIESLGGSVALFDFDNDGWIDVFLPGGGHYDGKSVLGNPGRLYRNLGNWKFKDVSKQAGLDAAFQYSHTAAAFDYDCDGWTDLLITGYNRLVLLRNQADGAGGRRFVEVTEAAGIRDTMWSTCAAWGDLDGDGFPEIYVTHYGNWSLDKNNPTDCTYDGKVRDVCQPRRFKPLPHTLYHNNGNGAFTDVTAKHKLRSDGRGIGVILADVNGDARPDIYVANDTDDNFLYLNRGKGKGLSLEEIGLIAGVARDDRGNANGSMGVDVADFDHSGKASILVSNYEGELPALYQNKSTDPSSPRFIFASLSTGLAAIGGIYVGWGVGFTDFDLDGWEDFVLVSGHAIRYPTKIDRRQKPVVMHNEFGRFQNASKSGGSYFLEPHNARGLAYADLDNDGKMDAVVSHLNEPVVVLRNIAPTEGRHWIGIEMAGKNHRDVIGARVVVEGESRHTRFAKGGGSYGATHDRRQIIGLGETSKVKKATVYWPSGQVQEFTGLAADRYWRLIEGERAPKPIQASDPRGR